MYYEYKWNYWSYYENKPPLFPLSHLTCCTVLACTRGKTFLDLHYDATSTNLLFPPPPLAPLLYLEPCPPCLSCMPCTSQLLFCIALLYHNFYHFSLSVLQTKINSLFFFLFKYVHLYKVNIYVIFFFIWLPNRRISRKE